MRLVVTISNAYRYRITNSSEQLVFFVAHHCNGCANFTFGFHIKSQVLLFYLHTVNFRCNVWLFFPFVLKRTAFCYQVVLVTGEWRYHIVCVSFNSFLLRTLVMLKDANNINSDRNCSVVLKSAISAYSAYSAIGRYHTRQGARYGEHGWTVRSRAALITSDHSDGPGVRSVRSAATATARLRFAADRTAWGN